MKKLIIGFTALMLSASIVAGVKEEKEKRSLIERTERNLVYTKDKCGNPNLKVTFEFEKYESYMAANAEEFKDTYEGYLYFIAKTNTKLLLKNLKSLCKDPDYKKQITKLETITVFPQLKYTDKDATFKISSDSKTLTAQLPANSKYSKSYKKELKAVW